MKNKASLLALLISLNTLTFSNLQAHEGHDHNVPGSAQPQKGGIIRSLENHHFELVVNGNNLKIYAFAKDLKPASVKSIPLKATVSLPKKKSASPIIFEDKGNYWESTYDAKGVHRYTLNIEVKASEHPDKLNFVIEPRRKGI